MVSCAGHLLWLVCGCGTCCWLHCILWMIIRILCICWRHTFLNTVFRRILFRDFFMQKICCILIWQIFQLILLSNLFSVSFGVSAKFYCWNPYHIIVYITYYQGCCISYMEVLIFYADKLMVMGNSKNSCVFNFVILLKSWKFDAHKIYVFYSSFLVAHQHILLK